MSHLPAAIALCSAAVVLAVGTMAWWMGRAPGWQAMRWFTVISLGSAAYAAGDLASSAGASDQTVVLTSHLQLAGLLVELWAWFFLAAHLVRREPSRLERWLRIGLPVVAALCLVPGLAYTDRVATHLFAPWNAHYREAIPTAFGTSVFAGALLAATLVLVRFLGGWTRGVPHSGLHALAMATLIGMGVNDVLAASSVAGLPYLLDIGVLLPLGAVAWSQTSRFVTDARTLRMLRSELEAQVGTRTAELLQARDALHQSERLAALGHFAAGVAHQVNNPASVVASNLSYLEEVGGPVLDAEARQSLAEARQAMQRIAALVRNLVDAGRLAGMPTGGACSIVPLVERLLATHRQASHARLSLTSSVPEGTEVRSQREALEKILQALLSNACEAIPSGRAGHIEVRVASDAGGEVVVEVVDDGVGMAPDVVAKAFDPFFTTRPAKDGGGLGLSVARALAQGLGGDITLRSERGGGTSARLVLPMAG